MNNRGVPRLVQDIVEPCFSPSISHNPTKYLVSHLRVVDHRVPSWTIRKIESAGLEPGIWHGEANNRLLQP